MDSKLALIALGLALVTVSAASAQVTGGVLYVSNSHMS